MLIFYFPYYDGSVFICCLKMDFISYFDYCPSNLETECYTFALILNFDDNFMISSSFTFIRESLGTLVLIYCWVLKLSQKLFFFDVLDEPGVTYFEDFLLPSSNWSKLANFSEILISFMILLRCDRSFNYFWCNGLIIKVKYCNYLTNQSYLIEFISLDKSYQK